MPVHLTFSCAPDMLIVDTLPASYRMMRGDTAFSGVMTQDSRRYWGKKGSNRENGGRDGIAVRQGLAVERVRTPANEKSREISTANRLVPCDIRSVLP
jgi:hypothetical protein